MSLQDISFNDTYWSGENDLINEFYIPCLTESVEYCRAVGYFSSSILCYINYICLFNYLFISSQMSAKPYFIGSTGILPLW